MKKAKQKEASTSDRDQFNIAPLPIFYFSLYFFILELDLKPDACKELSNAMSPWLLRKDSNSHQLSNIILRIANWALETYLDNQSSVQSKFHCVGIFFLENQILWSHHYTRNDKLYHNTLHSNDIQALFHGAV